MTEPVPPCDENSHHVRRSKNLNLSGFKGATLTQVAIGEHQIQFHFHPEGYISVEGKWELRDSVGVLLDCAKDTNAERDVYRVHIIIGKCVESCSVSAPDSFSLQFESGHILTVYDDLKQYESFSIQPGDIFV